MKVQDGSMILGLGDVCRFCSNFDLNKCRKLQIIFNMIENNDDRIVVETCCHRQRQAHDNYCEHGENFWAIGNIRGVGSTEEHDEIQY